METTGVRSECILHTASKISKMQAHKVAKSKYEGLHGTILVICTRNCHNPGLPRDYAVLTPTCEFFRLDSRIPPLPPLEKNSQVAKNSQVQLARFCSHMDIAGLKLHLPSLEFDFKLGLFICTCLDHGYLECDAEKIRLHFAQSRNGDVHKKHSRVPWKGAVFTIYQHTCCGTIYMIRN